MAHLGKLGRPVFGTTTKVCYLLCETEKRKEHGYLRGVQNGLARMAVTQVRVGTVFFGVSLRILKVKGLCKLYSLSM